MVCICLIYHKNVYFLSQFRFKKNKNFISRQKRSIAKREGIKREVLRTVKPL